MLLIIMCRLTVEEHLWIYARLKGMPATEISTEMDRFYQIDISAQILCCDLHIGVKCYLSAAVCFELKIVYRHFYFLNSLLCYLLEMLLYKFL